VPTIMKPLVVLALLMGLVAPTPLEAQDAPPLSRLAFGIGSGFARGSFTDRPGDGGGIVGAVQVAVVKGSKRSWIFEAQVEPFEVKKDGRDEHFTATSFLAGRAFGPVVVAFGVQRRSWEGTERVTDSDTAVTLSLALSPVAFPVAGKWSLRPDFIWRSHAAPEITSSTLGVRFFFVLNG
jgi:hypothetical protein